MPTILSLYQFTSRQADVVRTPCQALVVTAGAGSGKTRTLVGRYLALLESGLPLRSIVAITFTDKAAREMRARIRTAVESWLPACTAPAEQARWEEAFAALDGARIGTIHALCAEILRAHPAEAQVDPDFDVLDENQAALFKARAVEAALAWAATAPQAVPLFDCLTEYQLRQALATLVEKRLDVVAACDALAGDPLARWSDALDAWLCTRLGEPAWTAALDCLAHVQAVQPDDKLEAARREVLARWAEACTALKDRAWDALFAALVALRDAVSTGGSKNHWAPDDLAVAREAMGALRTGFDAAIAPLLKKVPVSWTLDERCANVFPCLRSLFERVLAEYERLKAERRALDFDDLEAGALALLAGNDQVLARWQADVCAVLVDEFQDTNTRQQQIVYALSAFPQHGTRNTKHETRNTHHALASSLFIVGDSKQSIYRFRGADVTVFRRVQADVAAAGGRHVPLDLTFRAHAPLVALVNDLLAPILGAEDDPTRPYAVPFAPLSAHREQPCAGICPPYLEIHLGLGENADEGHRVAASALASRLHRLHEEEGVEWGDMALLFRAATGFPPYEDALEWAGIPFVTVAGRGFYERPEVRDLLNGLAALADPTDDLALAGLLRSPAFALSDVALYLLRYASPLLPCSPVPPLPHPPSPCPLWQALHGPLDHLDAAGVARAVRAREIIAELHALAGRTTVGNLLARFLDATHYRAVLYLAGGHRLCRNVDKLLADAHRSRLAGVGEFLEYVQSLRDVAAREGEAPVEAGGAVQLMTVHKAKGLEFPVVVIADAARAVGGRTSPVLVSPDLGVLLGLSEDKTLPAIYRLASLHEADQEDAESRRLLYVAATRAKEKLIVSGHVKAKKDGTPELRGWLAWLGEVVGLDQARLPDPLVAPQPLDLSWSSGSLACVVYPVQEDRETGRQGDKESAPPLPRSPAPCPSTLIAPVAAAASADADVKMRERESEPPPRVWRVVPTAHRPEGPAWVVGRLVHTALRHWRFPDRPGLKNLLRPYALEDGLTDPEEIRHTIAAARRLLARFQAHPFYAELNRAERYQEVPYAIEVDGAPRSGIVDLLYRSGAGWTLVEFKTDELRAGADLEAHVRQKKYDRQVREYVAALTRLLGERPRALLVFLNVGRRVEVAALDTAAECGKIQLLNFNP
jgi:ATP-dependent helicase/nuclease subunit A